MFFIHLCCAVCTCERGLRSSVDRLAQGLNRSMETPLPSCPTRSLTVKTFPAVANRGRPCFLEHMSDVRCFPLPATRLPSWLPTRVSTFHSRFQSSMDFWYISAVESSELGDSTSVSFQRVPQQRGFVEICPPWRPSWQPWRPSWQPCLHLPVPITSSTATQRQSSRLRWQLPSARLRSQSSCGLVLATPARGTI